MSYINILVYWTWAGTCKTLVLINFNNQNPNWHKRESWAEYFKLKKSGQLSCWGRQNILFDGLMMFNCQHHQGKTYLETAKKPAGNASEIYLLIKSEDKNLDMEVEFEAGLGIHSIARFETRVCFLACYICFYTVSKLFPTLICQNHVN